jgi:hypothetical protein
VQDQDKWNLSAPRLAPAFSRHPCHGRRPLAIRVTLLSRVIERSVTWSMTGSRPGRSRCAVRATQARHRNRAAHVASDMGGCVPG